VQTTRKVAVDVPLPTRGTLRETVAWGEGGFSTPSAWVPRAVPSNVPWLRVSMSTKSQTQDYDASREHVLDRIVVCMTRAQEESVSEGEPDRKKKGARGIFRARIQVMAIFETDRPYGSLPANSQSERSQDLG
jgi:hypothetical protein